MLDLIVRNANLPDGRKGVDIAVDKGRIVEIGPRLEAQANREIDATDRLATPPFVDSHCHVLWISAALSMATDLLESTTSEMASEQARSKDRSDLAFDVQEHLASAEWAPDQPEHTGALLPKL